MMKRLSEYNTILFDLDNTILDFSKAEDYAIRKLMNYYGVFPDDFYVHKYIEINEEYWKKYSKKLMSKEEILSKRFEDFFSLLKISVDGKEADERYRNYLCDEVFVVDGAYETLKILSKTKKLYIVSNGVKKTQEKRIKKAYLNNYFVDIFLSEEIGYPKPDVRYFQYVINHIPNFDYTDTILVGDNIDTDIRGGKNANITTVFYNYYKNGLINSNADYCITSLEELIYK